MACHLALDSIQQEETTEIGAKNKCARAGLNHPYLLKIRGIINAIALAI